MLVCLPACRFSHIDWALGWEADWMDLLSLCWSYSLDGISNLGPNTINTFKHRFIISEILVHYTSHVRKLFPLNEWSHLFSSSAKEKENRLRWMTSFGTLAIFTVLQISMYVARCAYGSTFGRPWKRFPWISWMRECEYVILVAWTSGLAMLVKYWGVTELE